MLIRRTQKILTHSVFVALFSASFTLHAADPQLGKDSLDSVIAAMTLQEKVKLVRGTGMFIPGFSPTVGIIKDRVPGAAGSTYAVERLGIPSIVVADGPAGLRIEPHREGDKKSYFATAFPIASSLSSSWDKELTYQVGQAMGNETLEYGVDILLAPALNIHRYPLGGRNFEYYSEDPVLSGNIASAMVNGIQSQGVGTSIKHFVANNHEWNRKGINVQVSEEAMREIYLKGFEITVENAKPWTVMSSYNKVNGEHASESHKLLTRVLRDQWGFDGLVMTDWFGGDNAVAQMQAGNDLLMPGYDLQDQAIEQAVNNGHLDVAVLDNNIRHILNVIMKTPTFKQFKYSNQPDLKQHAAVARAAASEGMVLLKNQQASLPVAASNAPIAVFGNYSYDMVTGGTGSGDVNEAYTVSLPQGLEAAGFSVDKNLAKLYRSYLKEEKAKRPELTGLQKFLPQAPIAENPIDEQAIKDSVKKSSMALITIGRSSGEFTDRHAQNDFYLSANEHALLTKVSQIYKAANKPVVVILNVGGVIEVASWQDKADAILLAWQPGQEAGSAIADVLSGKVNPSGKLPTTFAKTLQSYPAFVNFPGEITDADAKPDMMGYVPAKVMYLDGTNVGYRHFDKTPQDVVYPFGYGLSYSQFTLADFKVDAQSEVLKLRFSITNIGKVAGKQVAQIYVQGSEQRSLKNFAKSKLLAPGEKQAISLDIALKDLAEFDKDTQQWKLAAGHYRIELASSSQDSAASITISLAETRYFAL